MVADIEGVVRRIALDNARKYDGKASSGSVVSKLISEVPDVKSQLKSLMPVISKIVADVNKLSVAQQVSELERIAPELLEKKKIVEEKVLKPLPNAELNKVVLRVAPSPSGPLHIGHALAFAVSIEYARMYKGKLILRLEDTNPENIYPLGYKLIEEDFRWLAGDVLSEVSIQSDHLGVFFDYAHKAIQGNLAYVCTCDADAFRTLINKKQACPCRELPTAEQLLRWDRMFVEYEPGEAVVRIKTRIDEPNPAMRDWPALRINHHSHPRQKTKYKVWPLMNFAVAVDDYLMKMTHTIRGKDHMDNAKRQAHIFDFFGWKKPTHLYFGLISFVGLDLSKTETKLKIERGEFSGWDDIRLPFLPALRRRGYQAQAFLKYGTHMGVNENDKTIDASEFFKMLDAFNREIIDPFAKRFFFVWDPVKIKIKNAIKKVCSVAIHPDNAALGVRSLEFSDSVFITKDDKASLDGVCRLIGAVNIAKKGASFVVDSDSVEDFRSKGKHILHWLPKDNVKVEVCMPDGSIKKGLGESSLSDLSVGNIVQFERFGFCRLDRKLKSKLVFWFTHK